MNAAKDGYRRATTEIKKEKSTFESKVNIFSPNAPFTIVSATAIFDFRLLCFGNR